jgi:hypothetical protein
MERVRKNAEIRAIPDSKVVKEEEIKQLLLPGEVGATLEMTVRDSKGKITEHRGPIRSESFVRQFLQLLWIQGLATIRNNPYQVRDTANVLQDICNNAHNFACDAGAGVVTHGIIVGTGNTAATIDDYVIETPIAHGVGAGQLQYGAVAFGAPAADAAVSQFTITRDFANGSGGAITVNECGLYVEAAIYTTIYYVMTIRDVIGGGINVPNGQTLTLNYRPQATA